MFDKVLSIPSVLNISGFWIGQDSEYVSGSECARVLDIPEFWMPLVLNMPGFWIRQSSEYARVTQGSEYIWIIPEYVWICLIMSGYVWICMNVPEYAWIFHISSFVLQSLFYLNMWLLDCMFLSSHVRVSEWIHTEWVNSHWVNPVWLNGWLFVYELSGCGSESSCMWLLIWTSAGN